MTISKVPGPLADFEPFGKATAPPAAIRPGDTSMSKPHTTTDYHGCYAIGERAYVREGLFAGHHGVIDRLRADGRPVFRMDNGALVRCEDAGQWLRPDIAPPPTQFYDRHLIPLGWGDTIVKVAVK